MHLGWKKIGGLQFAHENEKEEVAKSETALGLILMFEPVLHSSSSAQIGQNICNLVLRLHFAEDFKHLPIPLSNIW